MGYYHTVRMAIGEADIVMEVVDARFPKASRNFSLEHKIKMEKKKLLIVLNKSDLVSEEEVKKQKELAGTKSIFVSAKHRKGTRKLREALGMLSAGKEVKVAIIGYPNTGKSSIINMLKGKKSSPTSSTAGFTKGKQNVRINSKIMLIDTPGVIPFGKHDQTLMLLLGAKNVQQSEDIENAGAEAAQEMLSSNPKMLEDTYGIYASDGEDFLEKLALKKNKLLKKGRPDTTAAAKMLLNDFKEGKIGLKN
ncbi:MAG: 50S ribosome-binding GTPase [archaeon]|nr:50S ribosome-binding GTPase [archaeon]